MKTIEHNLSKKRIGGGKLLYHRPLTTQVSITGQSIICISDPDLNSLPGMGWGGHYNNEPTD